MKFSTFLVGSAALVGLGVYLGKKMKAADDFDNETEFYAEEKETYGDKFHKASMFAVGAVKTGAEKIAQGIKEIKSRDMVKKGEDTIIQAKGSVEQIKEDIADLKDIAVSINSDTSADSFDVFSEEDDGIMETKNNPFDN